MVVRFEKVDKNIIYADELTYKHVLVLEAGTDTEYTSKKLYKLSSVRDFTEGGPRYRWLNLSSSASYIGRMYESVREAVEFARDQGVIHAFGSFDDLVEYWAAEKLAKHPRVTELDAVASVEIDG